MAVIRQTEEKDELPALWRNVCMRQRSNYQSATGITSVISFSVVLVLYYSIGFVLLVIVSFWI